MTGPFVTPLITKLSVTNYLDAADIRAILTLPIRVRHLEAHETIVRVGDRADECFVLSDGYAFRSKTTPDGQRQILSLHIPGEIPDLQSLYLNVMDHDLSTMTPCSLGFIPHAALKGLTAARPNVAAAFWRETLIDAAIFREWIVNVGRRPGIVRMAHLLSELRHRLETIGRTTEGAFRLPITQVELGDCLGLSTVHVNRVLQELRRDGLLSIDRAAFNISDNAKLAERGQFDPGYLHQASNQ